MKIFPTLMSVVAVCASTVPATTIFTSDGNGADSYVRQGEAANNFGNATNVVLKGGNGSTTRKGYLRFDTSLVTQSIDEASITLTVATNNSGGAAPVNGQTFNIEFYGLTNEALDNWVEGNGGVDNLPVDELTYANAPANVSPGNNFNDDALLLGTVNVPGTLPGETVTFSEPALAAFLNTDTNGLAVILMRRVLGGSSNLAFSSKEGANAPQLDLTFASGGSPLEISDIEYNAAADAVTLTWRNTGAASYRASYSFDLETWENNFGNELSADDDERVEDPDSITVTLMLSGLAPDGKIFFRIGEDN